MKKLFVALLILILFVLVAGSLLSRAEQEYYRGVYDMCMNVAFYEKGLDLFDSIQYCKSTTKDAQNSGWFDKVTRYWKP